MSLHLCQPGYRPEVTCCARWVLFRMRSRPCFRLLPLTVLAVSVFSHAEENTEGDTVLEPVIVEETLPPAFQTYPELSTGQVTVIDREAFQADDLSVADVLENTPGTQIQTSGELGSFSTISIRGATGQQSLVFVDGVPVTSSGAAVDLSQIPLNQVESIEIYRTAAPPQFAQDAMGGVINIVTRRDDRPESETRLSLKVGSFGLNETSGSRYWRWGKSWFNLQATALTAENDFPYEYDAGTPDVPEDDVTVTRKNAGFSRYSGTLGVTRRAGIQQWTGSLSGLWSRKDLPAWNNNDLRDAYYQQSKWSGSIGWSATGQRSGSLDQSVRLRSHGHQGHLNDPESAIGLNQNDSTDTYTNHRLQHLAAVYWGTHISTLVNELEYGALSFEDQLLGTDYHYDEVSHLMALTDEWSLHADRLNLTGTARTLAECDGDRLWSGLLGVRYTLNPAITLKSNVSQTFRHPTLFERYGDQGYFQGNEDLVAERSQLLEVSLEYDRSNLGATFTFFNRQAVNNIAPVYDSQGVGRYVNIGEVQYQGIEWELLWEGNSVELSHQGAYQPSLISTPVAAYDGNQAPGYYRLSHQSIATYSDGPWRFNTQWRFETGLYYDRANSTMAPERSELDVGVQRAWNTNQFTHQIEVKLLNLLDQRSLDMDRKPLPGRQYVAGYSVQF